MEDCMRKVYHVEGMSCSSCAAAVEKIVKKIEGVENAEVNLVMEQLTITSNKERTLEEYNEPLKKGGFALRAMEHEETQVYKVEGMSCSSCSAAVEKILQRFDEITKASVNLVLNQVSITYTQKQLSNWQTALHKGGFALVEIHELQVYTLDISGMTCSSCSTSIEHALSKLNGLHEGSVNLLTNTATVSFDKSKLKLSEILNAIEKTGYHAKLHQDDKEEVVEKKDRSAQKIYGTLAIGLVLLYIGMSHMLGNVKLPLPEIIHYERNPFNFALIQFVLATIILGVGHKFFTHGMKSLFHGSPNMDTLVAIGTGSAYLYSLYSMMQIASGNMHAVHALYFESAGVVVALVQFGKYLEASSKKKSTGAISALLQLRPTTTTLLRDGVEIEVDVDEVSVGDVLVVKAGEHIAVDGVVQEGSANVDESMLTGESMPVKKQKGDTLIQGTTNVDGRLVMVCSATQGDTTLSKIIKMVEEAQGKKAPIARIADRISLYFVPTVMAIALLASVLWYFNTKDFAFALTIFVSVLVIACPCALGLATPTAIMVGTGKAAQFGIFIKSGEALETTSIIDTVVFDKTGTITIGKPVVTDITTHMDETEVLRFASALENGSKHPLATAILQKAKERAVSIPSIADIQTHNGLGLSACVDEKQVMVGSKTFLVQQGFATQEFEKQELQYLESGKTVVWVGVDKAIIGILAIADQLKKNAKDVIAQLKQQGIDVIMITGDNKITAQAIAKQAGIEHVIAQVMPDQKGEEVKKLQQNHKKVAMVGDGINDAVALTQSEVGIAIGSGSDVAIESADIVLVKDNIQDVVNAIRLSKAVIRNIKQNLFWAFFYNVLGIPIAAGVLYLLGGPLLSPVFAGAAMAFSSVSVVSNALRLRNFK